MLKFLFSQSNALPVTLWLIVLSIFVTLTVNPIAGYALSRFNLKGKDKIILFCLATSAFPAMVSAIPGYLLMRDLGLLNTFLALVLPGAASGMSIFILKGFFDSLPQELYEAATIDGAREWQIFFFVTMPMVKPILAINALHAFLAAYGGWEWALIICQDQKMWTLSVWLYQASQWWAQSPWIATAGFVLASIPTMIVFFFCQNIILRGIIVPSMK
jgi:multiple sugar transport system permease protein